MNKRFYRMQLINSPGYGNRIWVLEKDLDLSASNMLDALSMWGGSDKSAEDLGISWEVSGRDTAKARETMKNMGFLERKD